MSEQQKNVQEPDLNQLRKVRREKLSELQANGKDPYQIMRYDVSCHAMDIKENFEEMEGKQVSVAGRIMQKRDLWVKLLSVTCWISQAISSHMWQETALEKRHTKISRKWILETLLASKEKYLRPRQERFLSMRRP